MSYEQLESKNSNDFWNFVNEERFLRWINFPTGTHLKLLNQWILHSAFQFDEATTIPSNKNAFFIFSVRFTVKDLQFCKCIF